MQFCAFAALRGCWLSHLAAWRARAGVGWGGGAETWFCNRLRRPGRSGNALNDEPRVKKEREKKGRGGGGRRYGS